MTAVLARGGPLCCSLLFEWWRLDDLDGGDTQRLQYMDSIGILLVMCILR